MKTVTGPTNSSNADHPQRYNSGCSFEADKIIYELGFSEDETKLECIKAMDCNFGAEFTFNFCYGNVVKYLWRLKLKGSTNAERVKTFQDDLQKISWYTDCALKLYDENSWLMEINDVRQDHYDQLTTVKQWILKNYKIHSVYSHYELAEDE